MRTKLQQAAGVVLFRENGERTYLLVCSALTRKPLWEFPKGGIEAGETDREAAERELREEAGLAVEGYDVLDGFQEEEHYFFTCARGADRHRVQKQVTYFLAEWQRGKVQISEEALDFRWATAGEAEQLLRFPEKRRVLRAAEAWLSHASAAGQQS